jgi:hypothetical protein
VRLYGRQAVATSTPPAAGDPWSPLLLSWSADQRILEILSRFRHQTIPVHLAPEVITFSAPEGCLEADDTATLTTRDRPIPEWDLLVKSFFDRIWAFVLLMPLLPTLGMVAFLIKLDSTWSRLPAEAASASTAGRKGTRAVMRDQRLRVRRQQRGRL